MNDPQPPPQSNTEARAVEAAAIRRRWINLGELLAVLALLISGLTLWLNWSERSETQAEKTQESRRETSRAETLTLTAEASHKGARLDVKPASGDQTIQSQTIRFPSGLDVEPVEITGDPRIEARWFDSPLKKAREKAGLQDDSRGDERLPVLIETRFLVDGDTHRDIALYDVGYTIKGQLLGGHEVTLRGLSLVRRARNPGGLDARWRALVPTRRG
jgi:hypothetical protein